MLTRRIRVQVVAFIAVSLCAIAFIGFNYAGLGRVLGDAGYHVTLKLEKGGGLYEQAEVTYRGVGVGEVTEMRLTDTGMEAVLFIEESAPPIPADLKAVVANRSAIGEQYVDLRPQSTGAPYLDDGSVIPASAASLPLPEHKLLSNISRLAESVPKEQLRTLVDELYKATRGIGADLRTLLDASAEFTRAAAEALPETKKLINDGATVLRTQLDSAQQWHDFARSAKRFAAELASADSDVRKLISTAPAAANQIAGLLEDTNPEFSVLLANLLTTAKLFSARTDGLRQLFVTLPKAVAATSASITPDGGHMAVTLNFWNPPPCRQGYEGTNYRKGGVTTPAPFNTEAACTLPYGSQSSVRGSQNAPSGPVPEPAVPGSADATLNPFRTPGLKRVSTTLEELLWLPK